MDWTAVLNPTLIGAVVGVISTYLTNNLIERQKARQSKELQEAQNVFSIGATSHMATVAFDRHVKFCEEYFNEAIQTLNALIKEGHPRQRSDIRRLSHIRLDCALWLTKETDESLRNFEHGVRKLAGEARIEVPTGDRLSNEGSIEIVIDELKKLLQTEELTDLRKEVIARSSKKYPGAG